MAETHVNAFKADVADAKAEVAKVLGEAWDKVDALVAKLEGSVSNEPTPASVQQSTSEPQDVPVKVQNEDSTVDKPAATSTK